MNLHTWCANSRSREKKSSEKHIVRILYVEKARIQNSGRTINLQHILNRSELTH